MYALLIKLKIKIINLRVESIPIGFWVNSVVLKKRRRYFNKKLGWRWAAQKPECAHGPEEWLVS